MTVREVFKGVPVLSLEGRDDVALSGIAYASTSAGPGFLFAALQGLRADGTIHPQARPSGRGRPLGSARPADQVARFGLDPRGPGPGSANFYT
jgi:hypothetical protein